MGVVLTGCGQIGAYEGQTAEYWFNQYDLTEAKNHDLQNKLSDLESARDDIESQNSDLQTQYDDMESEKSELEDQVSEIKGKYDSLKKCVYYEGKDAEDCYYSH